MKLASKSAYAFILTAAFLTTQIHQASASPILHFAIELQSWATPVACKYGSGKCADVKAGLKPPSYEKKGPQDPTVDPDCKAYGNCHDGPNGGPAAAKAKGTTAKPVVAVGAPKNSANSKAH